MECATWAHVTAWMDMVGQTAAARYSHATVPRQQVHVKNGCSGC